MITCMTRHSPPDLMISIPDLRLIWADVRRYRRLLDGARLLERATSPHPLQQSPTTLPTASRGISPSPHPHAPGDRGRAAGGGRVFRVNPPKPIPYRPRPASTRGVRRPGY
ncbi:MAG: hypothetical protein ACLRWQ_18155 [Flavonifractor plautii]